MGESFSPFPVDALPDPLNRFVSEAAAAIGCDSSYVALPALAVSSASIGNSRVVQIKQSWEARAIVWAVMVGESGTLKSPPFLLVMKPIRARQEKEFERHADLQAEFETALAQFDKEHQAWKRDTKTRGQPPKKPELPEVKRLYVSDVTVEGLAPILKANPRGLLLARDELSGWVSGFNAYRKGGKGGDEAHWLTMFHGGNIVVDRKGDPKTLFVPRAAVSICGGIQPATLRRVLGKEHLENGLASRLLLAYPPRKTKQWSEVEIDPKTERAYAQVVENLLDLNMAPGPEGGQVPVVIGLSADAKRAFVDYYDEHAQEETELTGALASAFSKLEEYAVRLALIVHCVRWAANDPILEGRDTVDLASMKAGITLAKWFKGEARRVYAMLSETPAETQERELEEWIRQRGGEVTARQAQAGCRWLRDPGQAEAALNRLHQAGVGEWRECPISDRGGRPSFAFRLYERPVVNETSKSPEEIGFADADRNGELKTHLEGEASVW